MLKKLLLLSSVLAAPALAAEPVEIVTRFGPSTVPYRFVTEAVRMLNESQKEYEFKATSVLGANGEAADQRALTFARNGSKILLWTATSSFTFNRYIVGNTYDRDKDIIPLLGMTSVAFALQVAPDSKLENFEDFINYARSKPVVYMGNTASSVSVNMMSAILKKNYGLTNIKELPYERPYDVARAVITGEVDFTIFNPADTLGLKQLVTSNDTRSYKHRNVPTGKEVGMNDFVFNSQSLIAVPKEQIEFGEKIKPLFAKICYDQRFEDVVEKNMYSTSCLGTNGIKKKIDEELTLIEKYKDSIKFK